jgi:C-terminal processing protease CtpA/Prc
MNSKTLRWSLCLYLSLALSPFSHPGDAGRTADRTRTISNLKAFAKLYGYVRYFHPSDEASRVDWERFAVFAAGKVKGARNAQDLRAAIGELFLPVAPTAEIYAPAENPRDSRPPLPKNAAGLKVVAWQHKGVGSGAANSPYISARLNRENILRTGTGPGVILQMLDAAPFRGKEIKLRASVRLESAKASDRGQLWLRVDCPNGRQGFFDNMMDRPILLNRWKEYEIHGRVDPDALQVAFGAMLFGDGRLGLDDFRISVKNEQGQWAPAGIKNGGFEDGEPGKSPSSWAATSPGFTYKTEKGSAAQGSQWMSIENGSTKFHGTLFDKAPQVGEVIRKGLDDELFCLVPLALYSDARGTLGKNSAHSFEKLAAALNKIEAASLTADDEDVRIADVVIAWNIFQHFFPYFEEARIDTEEMLTLALGGALQGKTEKDFFVTLSRMVASLKDGHGNVFHKSLMDRAGLPVKVEWVENALIVTQSADPASLQKGDIILSIDGVEAERALLDAEETISGSPQWKRFKSQGAFGSGDPGSVAKLEIRRGNKILKIDRERDWRQPLAEVLKPPIELLKDGIFYVDLSRASWEEINGKIGDLARSRGVVFDLRGYPNGNHAVLCHLLKEKDTSSAWMQIPLIIYPDRENIAGWQKMGWSLQPREPRIDGKVAFITDGRAISYAESLMSFVEYYKLGEIVGQPTAGANGNVNSFTLPGGFSISWTGMKVFKHDGTQHHLVGIRPTIPASRTIKGVIEGRDELLERAVLAVTRPGKSR